VLLWWCKEATLADFACAWLAVSQAHSILADCNFGVCENVFCQFFWHLFEGVKNVFYLLKNIFFLVQRMSVDYYLPSSVVSVLQKRIRRHSWICTVSDVQFSGCFPCQRLVCECIFLWTNCQLNNVDPIFLKISIFCLCIIKPQKPCVLLRHLKKVMSVWYFLFISWEAFILS